VADLERGAALTRTDDPAGAAVTTLPPRQYLERARALGLDVATPGPWRRRRSPFDGALLLEDVRDDEPVALIYAGLPLAVYLEALAPATLFGIEGRP
jgi:hypothetical protein